MPLRCLQNESNLLAFELSKDEWKDLRELNVRKRHLRMFCCDSEIVLKTSRLGTQFFAHFHKGNCNSANETAEHLLAKTKTAESVKRAGWSVTTEFRGCTPDREDWVADVFATKGKVKIAFEIQWSCQDEETTKYRQERYKKSGVRALWLMRQKAILINESVPTFHLSFDKLANSFTVHVSDLMLPLETFITGALNKRLRFFPQSISVYVYGIHKKCWRCQQSTLQVSSLIFAIREIKHTVANAKTTLNFFDSDEYSKPLCDQVLTPHLLRKHEIGEVKLRDDNTKKEKCLSNGCFYCDAFLDRNFSSDERNKEHLIYSAPIIFDSVLARRFAQFELATLTGWYFDK